MESSKSQIKLPGKTSIRLKESEKHSSVSKINNPKKAKIQTFSLEHVKDKFIGVKGTPKRNVYENELRLDLLGEKIRQTRIKRKLTQEQLGQLVGVQKAQISKIENNFKDTRISTILKVFDALETKILLKII